MLFANRNGFFYVLDRATGKFLQGTPFVKVSWASGLDKMAGPLKTPLDKGTPVWPGNQGGTNWYPPAYSPRTGLFYFSVWENYATTYHREEAVYQPGHAFVGGAPAGISPAPGAPTVSIGRRGPIDYWTNEVGNGATVALDPRTGKRAWAFTHYDVTDVDVMTTASDLLFTGGREGYFYAFDAKNGELLWKTNLGGSIVTAPITYQIDGKQYVSIIAGNILSTFALQD